MALYTLTEFASYVQSDVDTATAQLLLDLATGLIKDRTGVDYTVTTATSTAKAIALEAAGRAYRNPEGTSSVSEAIDDYSVTNRWESASAEVGLYLTASEIARLRGLPRVRSVVLRQPA